MKTGRLDQILLRHGYVDQDQISRALSLQKAHGGRLGLHLVQLGAISEDELVEALAEQFDLPSALPEERDIPRDLMKRMPPGTVAEHLMLPLDWDSKREVLTLAVADPSDRGAVKCACDAFDAKGVELVLAPESRLLALGEHLLDPQSAASRQAPTIELPELFEHQTESSAQAESAGKDTDAARRVLMVTDGATHKNFLPAVFMRDGCQLTVVSGPTEANDAIRERPFDAIAVSDGMMERFSEWVKEGRIPSPDVEVSAFHSVSGALLDNPLPYAMSVRSLRAAVQALADFRATEHSVSPMYGLISKDVEALAGKYGLRRVAVDGLHVGAHLLLPQASTAGRVPSRSESPFEAFSSSLELAARLRFPWRVDLLLGACHELYTGRITPSEPGDWSEGDPIGGPDPGSGLVPIQPPPGGGRIRRRGPLRHAHDAPGNSGPVGRPGGRGGLLAPPLRQRRHHGRQAESPGDSGGQRTQHRPVGHTPEPGRLPRPDLL